MAGDAYRGTHRRALHDVVRACQDSSDEALMPGPVLSGLGHLLGVDSAAFHGVDLGSRQMYDYQDLECAPRPGPLSEDGEILHFFAHEQSTTCAHPLVPADVPSISTTTDRGSLRAWRSCSLYQEVFKPLGQEYLLLLCLPDGPGRTFRLVCWRGPGRDFGEREKDDLLLLLPHLEGTLRRARRDRVLSALTLRQRELLTLVAQGHTNYQIARRMDVAEGTVRAHLNHIYERLGVTSRTAAVTQSMILTDGRSPRQPVGHLSQRSRTSVRTQP